MRTMVRAPVIEPFPQFAALDGCHCVTNSLAKIFHFYKHPLSEEMLFGLGAGMGFIYWRMKMGGTETVFVGGRGNVKNFYSDISHRTGVVVREIRTSNARKAEADLLRMLKDQTPVMLGGDMAYLPWFELPPDYHFGGHTFVACGYDGENTVLASDLDQKSAGIKKGFFSSITLEQLRKARGSPCKPFRPENLYLEFDFTSARLPTPEEIYSSIHQTIEALLHSPIKDMGVRGIRHAAGELLTWAGAFSEQQLRVNLFGLYVSMEIGGTGGGCFRPMYARFLTEAADIADNHNLLSSADTFQLIGDEFSEVGRLFKDAATMPNLTDVIETASTTLRTIADHEEHACRFLEKQI